MLFRDIISEVEGVRTVQHSGFKSNKFYLLIRYFLKERISKRKVRIAKSYFNINPYEFYSFEDTIRRISQERMSIARFGTGEIECLIKSNRNGWSGYQKFSNELKLSLLECIENTPANLILAILPNPPGLIAKRNSPMKNLNDIEYVYYKYYKYITNVFDNRLMYADSTMFLFHHWNSILSFDESFLKLTKLKSIWNGRKVVFVYSKGGRFNPSHSFFLGANNVGEVLVPNINAFDKVEENLNECLPYGMECLFIVSAGIAATVLVYKLSLINFQAIDIGHFTHRLESSGIF